MLKNMKRYQALLFSGGIWFFGGLSLLSKGLRFLATPPQGIAESSIQAYQNQAVFYVAIALLIGFIKGRFILSKTVKRIFSRLSSMKEPISLLSIYDQKTAVILLVMFFLGGLMGRLPISLFTRGVIDFAIGSALMHGAILFIRLAFQSRKSVSL